MRVVVLLLPVCLGFQALPMTPVVMHRPGTQVEAIDVVDIAIGGVALAAAAGAAFLASKGGPSADDEIMPTKTPTPTKVAAPKPKPVAAKAPAPPVALTFAGLERAVWSGDAFSGMKWTSYGPRKVVAYDPRGERAAWSGGTFTSPARKSVPKKKALPPPVDEALAALQAKVKAAGPFPRAPAPDFTRAAWSGGCFDVPTCVFWFI